LSPDGVILHVQARLGGSRISFSGGYGSPLRLDIGICLDTFDAGDNLTFPNAVSFLYQQFSDQTLRVRS